MWVTLTRAKIVICVLAAGLLTGLSIALHGKPMSDDPAVSGALRQQFASETWVNDIKAARWSDSSDILYVEVDTANRTGAMAMCRALSPVVIQRSGAPNVGTLFIYDSHDNMLASNLFEPADRCYWRQ